MEWKEDAMCIKFVIENQSILYFSSICKICIVPAISVNKKSHILKFSSNSTKRQPSLDCQLDNQWTFKVPVQYK